MYSARKFIGALLFIIPLFLSGAAFGFETDDDIPPVTDRVARISFIQGDVQIRRSGAQEWEKAVLNLPVIEGDEITTDSTSRFEIQFDSYKYLRAAENSYLKIVTLGDTGIALSLPEGTLSLRVNNFDKNKAYFEIDIPKTTIAVQRSGLYRIDAGDKNTSEARVTVTEDGEARIYSENSGFTVRSGRTAKIFLNDNNEGEWETADASLNTDEFDTWVLDRDSAIAKRLKDAYYDKYYDRDIYGAEDLNNYGEWVYTQSYGYVWRPYRSSISQYTDWSPYRYGQWRWVPPYGWTWVNDESWGWATYHYGRWVWDDGYWVWSPYGYYRSRRSWWSPALVVVTVYNNNICWYPLPYRHRYYNYNAGYYGGNYGGNHGGGGHGGNNPSGGGQGTPSPSPTPPVAVNGPGMTRRPPGTPPFSTIPPTGVISVPADQFGKNTRIIRTTPVETARAVLKRSVENQTPPILPTYPDIIVKSGREILSEKPRITQPDVAIKTGAGNRRNDQPLDENLKQTRIYGDRTPLQKSIEQPRDIEPIRNAPETRKTGAVERVVKPRDDSPRQTPPIYAPPTRNAEPKNDPPVYSPAPKREERKYEPPRQETPPYVPPTRQETPKYEPPPRQEQPKYEPPKQRSEPPPQKSEPKPDNSGGGRKKDG